MSDKIIEWLFRDIQVEIETSPETCPFTETFNPENKSWIISFGDDPICEIFSDRRVKVHCFATVSKDRKSIRIDGEKSDE